MQKYLFVLFVLLAACNNNSTDEECRAWRSMRKTVEASYTSTRKNTEIRIRRFELSTNALDSASQAFLFYRKLNTIHRQAAYLYDYIEQVKQRLINEGGGFDSSIADVKNFAGHKIAPALLLHKQGDSSLSMRIRKRITDTRDVLINKADTTPNEGWTQLLRSCNIGNIDGDVNKWDQQYFGNGLPLTGVLTMLTKLELETANAENAVICKMLDFVENPFCDLGGVGVVAVTPKTYLTLGETYTAEVFLHYAERNIPCIVLVNGKPVPVRRGIGSYQVTPTKEGNYNWSAVVQILQTDGTIKEYPCPQQTYTVVRPHK